MAQPTPTSYANIATTLWGAQLAMTAAFAITMGGLAVRLRLPLMRALMYLWGLRVLSVSFLLTYWMTDIANSRWSYVVAAAIGIMYGAMLPVSAVIARCAGDPLDHFPGIAWRRTTAVCTLLAVSVHAVNFEFLNASAVVSTIWSRTFVFASNIALLYHVIWWMRRRPDSRQRLRPLFLGGSALMVFGVMDSYFRVQGLSGNVGVLDGLGAISSAMAGTLLFGLACIVAALEAERDAIAANAARLRDASVQAAEADRLKSLGSLAGGVAHDFNNVLGVILGGVELAALELERDPAALRDELQGVRNAATRGASLTRRLLNYSRRRPDAAQACMPAEILRELTPMLERLMQGGVHLRSSVESTARVTMDPTQFEQIVMNLVVNARDATKRGGTIQVTLRDTEIAEQRQLDWGTLQAGRWVHLCIRDSGSGIPATVRERMFEPFFTTKGAQGTGLGLATVANAVRDAEGIIDVQSVENVGTRFDIWFPALGAT